MPSSGMLRPVAIVRTDVSEERSSSINRITTITQLGTTLAVTSKGNSPKKWKMRKEVVLWDTILRMEGGVGVAGNGVGLLNCHTTRRDTIASVERCGVVYSPHRKG
jgi:hypothetical protein